MSYIGNLNQIGRGVQIYAPNGNNPLAPKPKANNPIVQPRPSGRFRPEIQALLDQGQQMSASQQEEEEEDDQPWWQSAAGIVIGNPVVQTALKPLEVLDYGRRAVTLGLEEFAEGVSGKEFAAQLNEDGSLKDTRSNMDKLKDPSYGVGQLFGDTWDDSLPGGKSNYYANALGFVGDVAFDPLTWTTGIGGAMTKAGTSVNKAARVGMAAKALDATGDVDAVRRFVTKGVQAVDDDFLKKLADAGVADIQRSQVRLGRRGAVEGRDGVARQMSVKVPVLSKISEAASKYSGEAANAFRQSKLSKTLQPGVEGLEDATNVLLRGGDEMSFAGAADKVAIANAERRISKQFQSTANDTFIPLRRELKKQSAADKRAILDSIEQGFATNFEDFGDIAAELRPLRDEYAKAYRALRVNAENAGLPMRMRDRYVPHILTRDAAKWMRDGGQDTLDVGRAADMAKDPKSLFTKDMYDPSGVTMARRFDKDTAFEINNKPIDFSDIAGDAPTIHEVNAKFREAGLDFDYFETSPDVILTKYIDMLSGDVGSTAALKSRIGSQSVSQLSEADQRLLGIIDDAGEVVDEAARVPATATIRDRSAAGRKAADDDVVALRNANGEELAPGETSLVGSGVDFDATTKFNQERAKWVTDTSNKRAAQIKGESARARNQIDDLGTETADATKNFLDDVIRQAEEPMPAAKAALGESKTELNAAVKASKDAVKEFNKKVRTWKGKLKGTGPKAQMRRAATGPEIAQATEELEGARRALAMMDGYLDNSLDNAYRKETASMRAAARKEINAEKKKLQKQIKNIEEDIAKMSSYNPASVELDKINKALQQNPPQEVKTRLLARKKQYEQAVEANRGVMADRVTEAQKQATGLEDEVSSFPRIAPIDETKRDKAVAKTGRAVEKRQKPARKQYTAQEKAADKRLAALDKAGTDNATDLNNIEEAFSSTQAARAVEVTARKAVADNAELVDRVAAEVAEAKKAATAGGKAAYKRPKAKNVDALEVEVARHIEDMKPFLDNPDFPADAKLLIQTNQNNMLERLKQIRTNDLTEAKYSKMKGDGNFGRIVVAQLDDQWSQTAKHLGGTDIVISKELENARKIVINATEDGRFWSAIDSLTALFKTYATMTPGFHVRNALSATFMNATEGVPFAVQREGWALMAGYKRAPDKTAWLAAQGKKDPNIPLAFEAMYGSGVGGQFAERGVGSRGSAFGKSTEWMFENRLTKGSQWAGGMVESSVRLPVALQTLRNGGDVTEAMQRITRTHFDYSQASKIDQKMKRLIPFWTFMSRNLPLQLTQMYTKPSTYAKYNSFVRNFSVENEPGTPEYFEGVGAFNTGLQLGGLPMYLQPDLAHTRLTEDIENIENVLEGDWAKALSNTNPLLTAPLEYTTGKDLFTGRQYDETDRRLTGPLEKPIDIMARILGQGKKTPDGNFAVDEKFINAIRAVVPLYDRGVRLMPGPVTGDTSQDAVDRRLESYLRFIGAPVRQLSPTQQKSTVRGQYYDELDKQREQQALAALDN